MTTNRRKSYVRPLALALMMAAGAASLTACVPLVVGGAAAGSAVVITDRRSSGTQLDDQNIEFKVQSLMRQNFGDTSRINATAYNGRLLLSGDAANESVKAKATDIARGVQNVKTVHNQLNVGFTRDFSGRTSDTWITSKVKSALLNTKFVPSATIVTTTDTNVVYLLGKVTEKESQYAGNAAAGVSGVKRVVKLFEIITRDEAVALSGSEAGDDKNKSEPKAEQTPAPIENGSGSNLTAPTGGSGGVEAMPIR